MNETPDPGPLPPALRWLKRLVTLLTITLICGVITIIWLLVTRLPVTKALNFPPHLEMPDQTSALAITQGPNWIGVVTKDNRFLIFNPNGTLQQEVLIDLPSP